MAENYDVNVNEQEQEVTTEVTNNEYEPHVEAGPSKGFVAKVAVGVGLAGYGVYALIRDGIDKYKKHKEEKAKKKAIQKDGETIIEVMDEVPDDIPEEK